MGFPGKNLRKENKIYYLQKNNEIAIPRNCKTWAFLQNFAKNERSSICEEAIRYNFPESVISKFPCWKTKNSEQKNQLWISADFLWNRADNRWSLLKQLLSFLIFPWGNAEHPWNLCLPILVLTGLFCNFSPGDLRSDAFRDYQPCSVLFQSCFSLIRRWSKFWSEIVKNNTN